jgi:hypothetical protein
VKFGSAWPEKIKTMRSFHSRFRGREPKEISLKKFIQDIHARVVEIVEKVLLK